MKTTRGFSLVELMVAITLALIVTVGVLAVFLGSRNSFQSTTGTAALSDNGRFALDFVQAAVRSAGYMACNTTQRQVPLINAGATPLPYNFTQALGGYEATGTGSSGSSTVTSAPVAPDASVADWTSGLDASMAGMVVKGNDVLVVRSTLRNTQSVYVTAISDGSTSMTVNSAGGLAAGQVAVISDCAKSVVMQLTGVSTSGSNTVLQHTTGGSPGNSASALPVSFSIGSEVTAVDTTAFYIGKGADGDSALVSFEPNSANVFTANELVPDIEAMQVLYGFDSTNTQIVSSYVTADQVTNFNSVMSVKIAVLAASPPGAVKAPTTAPTFSLLGTTVTAPMDTRMRQVFEITISLRNLEI